LVTHFCCRDEVFCDIKLETDDGQIIFGHKVVLASASPYFHAMFTNFAESNKDLVVLRQIDSTAIQLLIDFVYSGEIEITEKNVQVIDEVLVSLRTIIRLYIFFLLLFIKGSATSSKSLAVTRNKRGMLRFFTDTTAPYKLSWYT